MDAEKSNPSFLGLLKTEPQTRLLKSFLCQTCSCKLQMTTQCSQWLHLPRLTSRNQRLADPCRLQADNLKWLEYGAGIKRMQLLCPWWHKEGVSCLEENFGFIFLVKRSATQYQVAVLKGHISRLLTTQTMTPLVWGSEASQDSNSLPKCNLRSFFLFCVCLFLNKTDICLQN